MRPHQPVKKAPANRQGQLLQGHVSCSQHMATHSHGMTSFSKRAVSYCQGIASDSQPLAHHTHTEAT
jgi:hypothetical protein